MKNIWGFCLLFTASALLAQTVPSMEFIEEKHDFGTIEQGAPAVWRFAFKNVGKDTIKLQSNNIQPGCGCTSKSFTTRPIAPGDTGSVIAQYNNLGSGTFNKGITVMYGGTTTSLGFRGITIAPDTSKPTEAQKKKSPVFGIEKTEHQFGKVETNQKVSVQIVVKNSGKDTLKISKAESACSCIEWKLMAPDKSKINKEVKGIAPGKSGVIELVYAPRDANATDIITFYTNDVKAKRKSIALKAKVVSSLQEEKGPREDKPLSPFGN